MAEGRVTVGGTSGAQRPVVEPSASAALEHLLAGSHGVIAKRIDLALLEGREVLSHALRDAALIGLSIVLGAGAWFAVATCVVLVITPGAELVARLAVFAAINGGGAVVLAVLAMRTRLAAQRSGGPSDAVPGPPAVASVKGP
jgi:uncharacterized membrane protein YqjE